MVFFIELKTIILENLYTKPPHVDNNAAILDLLKKAANLAPYSAPIILHLTICQGRVLCVHNVLSAQLGYTQNEREIICIQFEAVPENTDKINLQNN